MSQVNDRSRTLPATGMKILNFDPISAILATHFQKSSAENSIQKFEIGLSEPQTPRPLNPQNRKP